MRFQQCGWNAFSRQQQGEHHAARSTSDNATGCLLRIEDWFSSFGLRSWDHFCSHDDLRSAILPTSQLYASQSRGMLESLAKVRGENEASDRSHASEIRAEPADQAPACNAVSDRVPSETQ